MGKVLVVDDEAGIRDLLREVLSDEGHQVVTARDGLEALEVLDGTDGSADRYLVLLDLMMPRLDGRGVIQALEARGAAGRRHRIIVMSAVERLLALNAGGRSDLIRDQLPKPFDLDTLIALVDRHAPPPPEAPPRDEHGDHNHDDGHDERDLP